MNEKRIYREEVKEDVRMLLADTALYRWMRDKQKVVSLPTDVLEARDQLIADLLKLTREQIESIETEWAAYARSTEGWTT